MDPISRTDKELKDVKTSIRLARDTTVSVTIIALAISHEKNENFINKVHCKRGEPIGNVVYQHVNDYFLVDCCEYKVLGTIPIGFYATSIDSINWKEYVPVPESIFKKYMDDLQREKLKKFHAMYKNGYDVTFLQTISDRR